MFSMLLKDLRLAPARNFLTGLSMFVGIVALILSVLIGSLGKSYLHAANEQLYGYAPHITIRFEGARNLEPETLETLHAKLRIISKHHAVSLSSDEEFALSSLGEHVPHTHDYQAIRALGNAYDVKYVSWGYNTIYNFPISQGRWFHNNSSPEMVINKEAAHKLQINTITYLTNKTWRNAIPAAIVGVVNDGHDTPTVYINNSSLIAFAPQQFTSSSGEIDIHNIRGFSQAALRSSISDMLTDTIGGKISDISDSAQPSTYEDVAEFLEIGFAISALLLLGVSALGLINIGLATIEQRSRELLIRRALGATRGSVAMLVLGGSLLIAIIVSLIAVFTTYLCVKAVPLFLPADTPVSAPVYPYEAAIAAVSAALLTAVIGSAIPAIKAARLQPALALR